MNNAELFEVHDKEPASSDPGRCWYHWRCAERLGEQGSLLPRTFPNRFTRHTHTFSPMGSGCALGSSHAVGDLRLVLYTERRDLGAETTVVFKQPGTPHCSEEIMDGEKDVLNVLNELGVEGLEVAQMNEALVQSTNIWQQVVLLKRLAIAV